MSTTDLEPDDTGAKPVTPPTQKTRRALSRLKRELTDEELASPGVQKLLLDKLEEMEDQNNELRPFRDKYHEADKQLAILTEKQPQESACRLFQTGVWQLAPQAPRPAVSNSRNSA